MSDTNSSKNKHMNINDRLEIQECLDKGMTFKAIAKRISKDPTTISKEVKKHCHLTASSQKSIQHTISGEIKTCHLLLRAPFVCNPCQKRHCNCGFPKQLYIAKTAQDEYTQTLSESREGIPLNKEDFYDMDRIISKCVKKGQHLYHILQTHDLKVSKSTVYRHLHKGYLSISPIDMPRVTKFKPRHSRLADYVPKASKIGRTYLDFSNYIESNNISSWVEMDTVIGRIGGKVIMTFDFTVCNFMFGLLLDDKSAASASSKIIDFKAKLNNHGFKFGEIFPILLTDNGGEFSDVASFENNSKGTKETRLFFCDPYKSSQKPRVEKNHTLFRDIAPKGKSFDDFTQETIDLIFSHINSVKRNIFNGRSPYEMFSFMYGEEITHLLGISKIPADEVIQSPLLLN